MKTLFKIFIASFMILAFISITACSSKKDFYTDVPEDEVAQNTDEALKIEKSGAQLWGEVCNRCHIAPSPADYNDTDWETISLHMRIRANLTKKEITAIKGFLKSAN